MDTVTQPTIELKLPETGDTVVLKKFLTIGQSRELQRMLLQGGKFDSRTGQMGEVPIAVFMDMQDKALEFLIVNITHQDNPPFLFTKDWVDNLSNKDGQLLYDQVNDIMATSNLTDGTKKN